MKTKHIILTFDFLRIERHLDEIICVNRFIIQMLNKTSIIWINENSHHFTGRKKSIKLNFDQVEVYFNCSIVFAISLVSISEESLIDLPYIS